MSLASGTRLGPYEVLTQLGAGGMGEVYKARDTRLDRIVAVKVIIASAEATADFRERFDREARVISALDHPHICALHDVGHERVPGAGGTHREIDFLVMQFLEGETLADRLARASKSSSDPTLSGPVKPPSGDSSVTMPSLATVSRGPLPVDVALRYAAEIADALDAAHRRGIVHRDLKPGNVMLTKTGTKLLDFGLAKLAPGPIAGFGDGATRTSPFGGAHGGPPLTGQGAILGTLHYMSPEQLEGRDVDARSDIFSFGALLFEMLSGRRAFEGPSHAGVIAAILGAHPPELGTLVDTRTVLPVVARRALERLLSKCLAKDPDDRWQSAADLADELRWINEERLRAAAADPAAAMPSAPQPVAHPASRTRERVWMGVAGLAIAAGTALAILWYPRIVEPPSPVTFTIVPPEGQAFSNGPGFVAITPDGQRIAYMTSAEPDTKLWIRPLGSLETTHVPAANGAWHVAFSPNGQSIVFTGSAGETGLKRVDLAGGPARTIAESAAERPAWGSAGVILFTPRTGERRLMRVPEAGGSATPATQLDPARQEILHSWPVFLPDGRRFVYLARTKDPAKNALFLASLDSTERTHLVGAFSMVDYVPGYLVYQRDGTLVAHAFDEQAGRLTGEPMPLVPEIQFNASNGRAGFAVSRTGVLVYRSGGELNQMATLAWFDRSGKMVGSIGQPGRYQRGAWSRDRKRLMVPVSAVQNSNAEVDLYTIDERGISSRFTTDPAPDNWPLWTIDNSSVVFSSRRKAVLDLYIKDAGGATPERVLLESGEDKYATTISPDGKFLVFTSAVGDARRLWVLPMNGDGTPYRLFPNSTESERGAAFSPDGKWVAYVVTSPGRENVYVQPFPPTGYREQISATSGASPQWTADGRQIVFIGSANQFMIAEAVPTGTTLRVGVPKPLFTQRQASTASGFVWDARADRFLVAVSATQLGKDGEAPPSTPLTAVVNWLSTFKR